MVDAGGHRYLMGIEKWQLVVVVAVVGLVSLIAVTREIVVDIAAAAAAVALLLVVRAIVASAAAAAAPCLFLFFLSVELEEVRYFACPFVLYDGTYR